MGPWKKNRTEELRKAARRIAKKHGGKRPGAGRPVERPTAKQVSTRLSEMAREELAWLAEDLGLSRSEVADKAIIEYARKHRQRKRKPG